MEKTRHFSLIAITSSVPDPSHRSIFRTRTQSEAVLVLDREDLEDLGKKERATQNSFGSENVRLR